MPANRSAHSHSKPLVTPAKATMVAGFGGVYPGGLCCPYINHPAPMTPMNAATTCEVRITGA